MQFASASCFQEEIDMMYLALVAFGFLVGWMVRDTNRVHAEQDQYNAFYHAEYTCPVVSD